MIYVPFNYNNYNYYSIYGDKIIFFKNSSNYINNTNFNTTNYNYAIYFINTCEFVEFSNSYLPYEFISFSHLNNIRFSTVYDSNGNLIELNSTGNPNPTYSTIYLSNDFTQFTNNIYYSPKFPHIFICGFINLLIILFIINGLTRLIFKGGIFFHK